MGNFLRPAIALLVLGSLALPVSGAAGDFGFSGTFARRGDGRFEFSMADGSHFFVGPDGNLDIDHVAGSTKPRLKNDRSGRITFASNEAGTAIYVFRYSVNGSYFEMVDAQAKVVRFLKDRSGRIHDIYFPNRRHLSFP